MPRLSKHLNESPNLFGLTLKDGAALLTMFVLCGIVLDQSGYEIFGFISTGCLAMILVPIRLSRRSGFIRDVTQRVLGRGKYYDPH